MKQLLTTLIFFFVFFIVKGQDTAQHDTSVQKNYEAFTFELLGNGLLFSMGLEKSFSPSHNAISSYRIGATYHSYVGDGDYPSGPGIFVEMNRALGKHRDKFEYGFGVNAAFLSGSNTRVQFLYLNLRAGYKLIDTKKGFLMKASFTPIIPISVLGDNDAYISYVVVPWVGLSIGKLLN